KDLSMKNTGVVLYFASLCCYGQGGANLNNNNVVGRDMVPLTLKQEKVDVNDVLVSCFWSKDWLPARVYMKKVQVHIFARVKLDLYSSGIHYLNDKGEVRYASNKSADVAFEGGIDEVILYSPTDTSKIATFKMLSKPVINDQDVFAQILARGKISFLK